MKKTIIPFEVTEKQFLVYMVLSSVDGYINVNDNSTIQVLCNFKTTMMLKYGAFTTKMLINL